MNLLASFALSISKSWYIVSGILAVFLGSGIHLVKKGHSCARIRTKEECEKTAQTLGLSDTTADKIKSFRYPPFCYYKEVTDKAGRKGLKFNTAADSSMPCHTLRQCLCQDDLSK